MSQFIRNIIENLKTLVAHENLNNLTIVQRSQAEYLYKTLILFLREENHEQFAPFQKECNFDFSFQEEDFNYLDASKLNKLFFKQTQNFHKFLILVETSLEHYIKQNNLQETTDILSKINFIHGTTTNFFALGTSLKPTGKLLKQGTVPFGGELDNGISLNGINMEAISSASVSSHAFIWNAYSQQFIVTAEKLTADLHHLFTAKQFKNSLADFTHYLICCQRLKQFDEGKFKEVMDESDHKKIHE